MQKALVIGIGVSGRSAVKLLKRLNYDVFGVDKNSHAVEDAGIKLFAAQDLSDFDLVVVSPGIPQTHPVYHSAVQQNIPLVGEAELACRLIKQPMIGITGTNGKTTVTELTAHVLGTLAVGNVGHALSEAVDEVGPLVAELSSYQLETMSTKCLDAAVILNITPDHLDRYGSMESYAKAKFKIAEVLKFQAPLFVEERCLKVYGHLVKGLNCYTYGYHPERYCFTDHKYVYIEGHKILKVPSTVKGHDLENLMASFLLCHTFGVTPEVFLDKLATFKKPPHRIEFIKQVNGINFYDDSKGTNIDAVIRAIETIDGHVVLIAGGVDKGAGYAPWIEKFHGKVKCVCAIGEAADKIKEQLEPQIPVEILGSLDDAVKHAANRAAPGETVLLSPGCSSFDMFRDYAHRGQEFQRIVKEL